VSEMTFICWRTRWCDSDLEVGSMRGQKAGTDNGSEKLLVAGG
jgi:hypothetical protein